MPKHAPNSPEALKALEEELAKKSAQPDAAPAPAPAAKASPKPEKAPAKAAPAPKAGVDVMNGFDLTRPFRLAYTFTRGFLRGTLSGVGAGGRYGLLAGIVVGMLATAGPLGMGALIAFPIAGALIGIGIGLVAGLIGGTVKGVDRTVNKEKYELERAARQKARSQHQGPRGFQYEEAEEAHRERSDITFDRNRQQNQENERDLKTYWQDRVSGEQGASWSKGM